jgi:hypothetical protein
MGAALPKSPANGAEKLQEENLLAEFADFMGADVTAVRLSDKKAGGWQNSPPHVISVDQAAWRQNAVHDVSNSTDDTAVALEQPWSELPGDIAPLLSFDPHERGTFPSAPSVGRGRSGRAIAALAVLILIGAGGFLGAWALNAAPGARIEALVDMAAGDPAKASPPLHDTLSSVAAGPASVSPSDQAGKQDQTTLASSDDRSSEPLPPSTPALSPALSNSRDAAEISSPPAAQSIAKADTPPAPPTPVGQTPNSAAYLQSLPDSGEEKTSLVRLSAPVPNDSESPADATRSLKPAEAPALAASSALPDPAPMPRARPKFLALANSPRQPLAHKTDAISKSSPKSMDHAPNPKVGATVDSSPRSLDVATAPSAGVTAAPEKTEAPRETTTPTDAVLQFVPNLFDKSVNAVRGLIPGG